MSTRGSKSIPELPYDRLNKYTNNFSYKFFEDQFGKLYKGTMDDGTEIAVMELTESTEKIFKEVVQNMLAPEHKNIARLVGFCSEEISVHKRLLCYEYLPNIRMSLHSYLFAEGPASSSAEHGIHWDERFAIVKGICQGLCCLHKLPVIHLDLKPANIWLDENMVPKIGCFGLYKFFGQQEIIKFTSVAGSNGYMAPEYRQDGITLAQADIYSLGLMIIEITTGVKKSEATDHLSARRYIEKIRKEWTPEHIASVYRSYDAEKLQQVYSCIKVGLECLQLDREKRPAIGAIVDRLNAS